MSMEINPPMSLHAQQHNLPATLEKSTEGDVVGQLNTSITKMPSGEHSNRLHSQIPNTVKTENTQAMGSTLAANAARTTGLAGQTAISNLNLLPTTMSALHVAATNTSKRLNSVSIKSHKEKKVEPHHKSKDDLANNGESEDEESDDFNNADESPTEENNRISIDRKDQLFSAILNALVEGKQFNLIKQLENRRRIVAIFPNIENTGEIKSIGSAYMLWVNSHGRNSIASFVATIIRNDFGNKELGYWVTACGYKDRAIHSRWQLKIQSSYSHKYTVAFQIGDAAILPEIWKDIRINISDAFRFWLKLENQFSLQIVISNKPLIQWD